MKHLHTISKNIIWVILCLVLAVNAYLLYGKLVLKQELPSVFGYSQVIVLSGSMEPEFSSGDVLLIKKETSYQVGDIITFSDHGSMVTHRIVNEENGMFQTQGDANNTQDGNALTMEQIHGTLQKVIPKIGYLFLFLKTPFGILCMVIAGFLIVEIPYLLEGKKRTADTA